ncbi:alpha/beta hydrolase [Streptomyces sioyaensis]|uniref:alpha/beta fold hydrolase n=1 Tax=Streptomyces sioyaensis TaxID=67364 RepID=UPI00138665CC|nr:alpha/beta hydrolase [Streptomyces sioyaensis]MBM4793763.1 alpha/beta hydrolase [Streptomyces sioyaensis]
MSDRIDALPRLAGGLLGAGIAAGTVSQFLRHRRVMHGHGDEPTLETGAGNLLSYRFSEPERPVAPDAPVLVFETALLSTAEHWAWLETALATDHPVLSYNRAGYGPSEYRKSAPFTLGSAVADLVDLVRGVCGARPVVLTGHSLGGYLALRALRPLREAAAGAVLIDPSHPAELLRSHRQAEGARRLGPTLSLMPTSMRLGLGALLSPPQWLGRLPTDLQRLALAQYRDWKLWQAGAREWEATYGEFLHHDGILPEIGVPLRLVAATRTHERDPTQAELHQEIVAAAPHGDQFLIDDTDHDALLLDRRPACRIAELISDFVTGLSTKDLSTTDPSTKARH